MNSPVDQSCGGVEGDRNHLDIAYVLAVELGAREGEGACVFARLPVCVCVCVCVCLCVCVFQSLLSQ